VRCACAAPDYGKNVYFGIRPVLANSIGDGGIFVANHLCGVGEVMVRAVFPFPYLDILIEEYRHRPFVCPTNQGSRSRMKSGLCAGDLSTKECISSGSTTWHEVRESCERPSSASTIRMGNWVG
jgi:hypothetical protein